MVHDALANGRSSLPVVSNFLLDSEFDWENVEFFVKWKGQLYKYYQRQSLSELQNPFGPESGMRIPETASHLSVGVFKH
ncbi:CHROMATIN REMODELING 5 protein [Nymphaea thermarum]|nr:CHROMATIN REMODELING 5 protein [Nymphaea thermarum]